jgi:hypothetical protein
MTLALYVIASTVMVLVLSARLRGAQEELARAREEPGGRAQAADRQDQAAYTQALALSLAFLLAGIAAWYAPPQPSARPAGAGRAGNTAGATAGPDRGTAE